MQKFKTVMLAFAVGVVLGGGIADASAPGFLTWWNTPGGGQALCNCVDVVRSTASTIIKAHWIGGAVGGVLFAIIAIFTGGSRAPTPPSTPA